MIYHGTTPIISAYIGITPLVGITKGTEELLNESNFILADNNMLYTADNNIFTVKEAS